MNDEMGLLRGQRTTMLYEEKWPTIKPTVLKLLQQLPVSQREYHELFYTVHIVCMWDDKGPAKLREALREEIVHFIKGAQERVLSNEDDQALLKSYIAEWRKFFTQCDYLPSPFRQLEITLLGNTGASVSKKPIDMQESAVRSMMLEVWNTSIFSDIKHRLQGCAMKLVKLERKGVTFDSQLVVGVRQSYVSLCSDTEDKLKIYRDNFEKAYLESTERFFKSSASEYLRIHGVKEYMRYADLKLREEEKRAEKYLEPSGVKLLIECCVEVLVKTFKTSILAECPGMITNNSTEELNLMFKLLDRIPDGIEPMLRSLEDHIVCTGLADMLAAAPVITQDCEKYVEQLLRLFNQFSDLVKDAFNIDPRFLTARDKAFKRVVDDTTVFKLELPTKQFGNLKALPESKCPELLANYCDMLLRKTPLSKRLTSDEIESKLHDILLVLKYVQNKDVFMRYHKAHLTRRLILDTSADSEKEENMVECFREVGMPADYVSKLSRMFQDIKVSEDLNLQFKERYRSIGKNSLAESINIKILNAGAWSRSSERVTVSLPLELEDYIPEVEDFYKAKHNGRKLQWYHHMSNGTVTFTNDVGKFDLDVTTFQMAVLFTYNERPLNSKMTYDNLLLATELSDIELRKTLWSLVALPKLKKQVLCYEPEVQGPKDLKPDTSFWVNNNFAIVKNNRIQSRGKLNMIGRLQLTTEKSTEEDNDSIVQLRILRVQEAIIKILKMRKTITNQQLQTQLIDILKDMFLPSKKLIKEQIEWLIEHKYMKRDEDDINKFVYIT